MFRGLARLRAGDLFLHLRLALGQGVNPIADPGKNPGESFTDSSVRPDDTASMSWRDA